VPTHDVWTLTTSANGDTDAVVPHDNLEAATVYIENNTTLANVRIHASPDGGATFVPATGTAMEDENGTAVEAASGVDARFVLSGYGTHLRVTVSDYGAGSGAANVWVMFPRRV
jgi:hypothetical protein